jgi:hypothetical protein
MTVNEKFEPAEVKNALYAWAIQNAVLADDSMREAVGLGGDASLIPFDSTHADYFRTRKIVKVSASNGGRMTTKISLATRLPIARSKRERLSREFEQKFSTSSLMLELVVEKPFKIDQNVQSTYKPLYSREERVCCGSSIGLGNQRNAGTMMALASSSVGQLLGISCNHVTGGCNTASVGTPIVAPGIQDVSPDQNEISVIGLHDSTGPMSQGLPQVFDISNNCDIAFFDINDPDLVCSQQGEGIDAFDTPTKFAKVKQDIRVKKWGRSTGLTHGEVTKIVSEPESIEYNVTSYYGPTSSQTFKGTVYFSTIYEVESIGVNEFSAGGDSGSLVVTDVAGAEKIVGILIGGNSLKSYVLPIKEILKNRKITLLDKHNM